jgi:hypothetical protein
MALLPSTGLMLKKIDEEMESLSCDKGFYFLVFLVKRLDVCFFVSGHPETARTHAVCVSLSFSYNVNQRGTLEVPTALEGRLRDRQTLLPDSLYRVPGWFSRSRL